MKNIFLTISIVLSLLMISYSQPTQLTYFTQHEVEQQSDYIQIGITVHCQDSILKKAVAKADSIVQKLQKIVNNYCNSLTKKKSECEDAFEASKHNIQPKYQLVRKAQTFIAFVVSHQITIKIRKLDGIGKMTDQLLQAGEGLITIDSFEWQAENQQNPEKQALRAGLSDGEQFCQRMGLKLTKILSAEEVEEVDEEAGGQEQGQEQGGQEEQEEQEPAQVVVFKFDVQCS